MNSKSMDKRGSAVNLAEEDVSVSSPLKIHEKPIEDVIAEFQSHAENGISQAEAQKRLEEDGPNELEKPPRISLLMLFIIQLNSVIMYLLIGAVIASAAIKATGDDKDKFLSYIDSIAIMIIVLINATMPRLLRTAPTTLSRRSPPSRAPSPPSSAMVRRSRSSPASSSAVTSSSSARATSSPPTCVASRRTTSASMGCFSPVSPRTSPSPPR